MYSNVTIPALVFVAACGFEVCLAIGLGLILGRVRKPPQPPEK